MALLPAVALLYLAAAMLAVAQSQVSTSGDSPEVIADRATPAIFPVSWLSEKINAKAELFDEDTQDECREIVHRALAKYPPTVLSANLKKVYVLSRLEYRGLSTGGTRSRSAVYVVRNEKYSPVHVERNVHAEFSSILFMNFPLQSDKEAWEQINPPDFRYRGSGVQAVGDKQASLRVTDALCEEGFLNEYGKASIEEDFNSFAARLFVGDEGLWSAVERYPKVKAKADLTIAFYRKLDAKMIKTFFLSLRDRGRE